MATFVPNFGIHGSNNLISSLEYPIPVAVASGMSIQQSLSAPRSCATPSSTAIITDVVPVAATSASASIRRLAGSIMWPVDSIIGSSYLVGCNGLSLYVMVSVCMPIWASETDNVAVSDMRLATLCRSVLVLYRRRHIVVCHMPNAVCGCSRRPSYYGVMG